MDSAWSSVDLRFEQLFFLLGKQLGQLFYTDMQSQILDGDEVLATFLVQAEVEDLSCRCCQRDC